MTACEASAAVRLVADEDDAFEEEDLPEVFTRTDEASAAAGGRVLQELQTRLVHVAFELALIERALRQAEPGSPRAGRVRAWVRETLAGLEHPVLYGIDQAHCALIYRWGQPQHVAGTPATTQPPRAP